MKLALAAWGLAAGELLLYEGWAIATGHTSLSRAFWTIELSPYGGVLVLICGGLAGHFVTSWRMFAAFMLAFFATAVFWHRTEGVGP